MRRPHFDHRVETRKVTDKPEWEEIILAAMSATYPTDQALEHMLDRLERRP